MSTTISAKKPIERMSFWVIPGLRNRKEIPVAIVKQDITDRVVQVVCEYYGLTPEKLFESKSQRRELVFPRQLTMFMLKKYTNMSLKDIGEKFVGRGVKHARKDHTTVIHSIATVKDLVDTDDRIRQDVRMVECKIL